ncbi:MAG: hypothetical protein H0W99_14510 [Acidobacteria bacterium]|nr:hypothetical protein [Acidobacteriota bacterium]
MLKLLLPALLICLFCASPSLCRKADDLYISITLTRGERSRDSGGSTTTITLAQDRIIYERVYHGMAASRQKPVRKEFKFGDEEKGRLIELIRARELLVEDSIKHPLAESGIVRYFKISIQLEFDGKKRAISIEGPTNAVKIKDQNLYRNATALIEEIYKIINLMDKEITYEALID